MAFWRTKAAISLKRGKMEEKLLWTVYMNSNALSSSTIPDPSMASPSSRLGVCNLATSSCLKLRVTSNFVGVGSNGTKGMKNVGNSSRGRSQRVPKIYRAPMYREGALRGHLCDRQDKTFLQRLLRSQVALNFKFSGARTPLGELRPTAFPKTPQLVGRDLIAPSPRNPPPTLGPSGFGPSPLPVRAKSPPPPKKK